MSKQLVLDVNGTLINLVRFKGDDYISLTDIANAKDGSARAADIIKNWVRNRGTLEFIGTWELLNNQTLKWSNSTTLKCRQVCQPLS